MHQPASGAIAHFGFTHYLAVIIESVPEPGKWVHSIIHTLYLRDEMGESAVCVIVLDCLGDAYDQRPDHTSVTVILQDVL